MKMLKVFYGPGRFDTEIDIVVSDNGAEIIYDLLSKTEGVVVYKISDELVKDD